MKLLQIFKRRSVDPGIENAVYGTFGIAKDGLGAWAALGYKSIAHNILKITKTKGGAIRILSEIEDLWEIYIPKDGEPVPRRVSDGTGRPESGEPAETASRENAKELLALVNKLINVLSNMPTHYFESKYLLIKKLKEEEKGE
jgi:hypothetical protein